MKKNFPLNIVLKKYKKHLVVRVSIQGPAKRQLILTAPIRPSKKQSKKVFELIELK
jgi:hypothetical protein